MKSAFKKRLALPKTSWQLCLLAIIGGCASASLVILFTLTIDAIIYIYQTFSGNYNSLSFTSRLLIPLIGVALIFIVATISGYKYSRTGIPFVLHQLKTNYGIIPFRNTINQFFGGAIALASGFSVGKEGPAVHLGAACAGLFGNKLNLPYNSIRTLCACGIAAGISACFNTPVAAVIFVMEVILREYKVDMFIPIMLAAIVGSIATSSFLGPAHELGFFVKLSLEAYDYPYLIILGLILGSLASLFNHQLIRIIRKVKKTPMAYRFIIAALITTFLSYLVPNAFTGGLSQISFALYNDWQWHLIAMLLAAKIIMTITALGLGIPGGIIGPILSIGAIAGIFVAITISTVTGHSAVASDFALMGMAGFMAATLNAPLAALLAVVELSNQLEVIMPAMVIIATACLSSGQLFKNRSIFTMQLDVQELAYRQPPLESALQRVGVIGIMKEHFIIVDINGKRIAPEGSLPITLKPLLISKKLINGENCFFWHEQIPEKNHEMSHQLTPISSQATLAQAYEVLQHTRIGGVYIYDKDKDNIIGVLPFKLIRQYLTEGKLT